MLTKITSQHMGLNLVLDGLAQVNYLVGVNGSGKTRLMQSIKSRMTLYVDQLREPKPDDAVAVTFFSNDADVYQIIKDGSIANNPFDLDLFMVQGEKRTALGLGDDFKNHPLTQKLLLFSILVKILKFRCEVTTKFHLKKVPLAILCGYL